MNCRQFKFRPFEVARETPARTSSVPGARSGHRICCDDRRLYVFGGYNYDDNEDTHNLYREILSYNFISKHWEEVNNFENEPEYFPDELASSSMSMYGSNLVIFGGTSYPFGEQCSNKVSLVAVEAKSNKSRIQQLVTTNDDHNQPQGLYGMAVRYCNGYLYTVGGTQGYDYSADIFRLNFRNKKWELVARSRPEIDPIQPVGRYRHEIASDERYIYIFGGGNPESVFDLEDLPAYDLKESQWCSIKTLPDPVEGYPLRRKCHSLVQYTKTDLMDNKETIVLIAGGTNLEGAIRDIWQLSLKTLRWMKFKQTTLPTTLFFHDACVTSDGAMYIFGGITTNTVRSDKLLKMWVTIPKLSVMCWEAIQYYYPQVYHMSKRMLRERGVPINFVERIHPESSNGK